MVDLNISGIYIWIILSLALLFDIQHLQLHWRMVLQKMLIYRYCQCQWLYNFGRFWFISRNLFCITKGLGLFVRFRNVMFIYTVKFITSATLGKYRFFSCRTLHNRHTSFRPAYHTTKACHLPMTFYMLRCVWTYHTLDSTFVFPQVLV